MPDPPVVQSPTDPKGAADLARYLQGLFAPAQTGASDLLAQVTRPGGIYDPSNDLAAVRQKSQLANTLPTTADVEAQNAQRQSQGADFLYQQLQGVQVPQEQLLQQPNLPQLNLPDQPQTARPQVSPLASLLAIGAGFASPKAAGQFNAAAIEGAIKGAEEENARRQQRDKTDVARRAMIYDASMSAAKEQQRIIESNRDAAFRNTVATTDRQMLMAKAATEQYTAHGAADSLKAFADKYDPALRARDEVKSLLDEIDAKGKASSERVKSVTELLNAVHKEDSAGPGMAKNVFDQIMKGVQQAADQRADEANAAQIAKAAMERTQAVQRGEMARTNVVQAHEDKRVGMQTTAAMSRLMVEEKGRADRQTKMLRDMKPSVSLKQSEANQTMLRKNLEQLETSIAGVEADLSVLQAGGTINGLSGDAAKIAYGAKRDSLINSRTFIRARLQSEQDKAKLLDPKGGVSGTFDPSSGSVTFP